MATTAGTLRKLVKMLDTLPDTTKVVTAGDYLHGPKGVYDLPTHNGLIYVCCAMGGCSWRHTPDAQYERALYWTGN